MSRRPVPFRGGGFRPLAQPLVGLAAFVVLIAGWQAAASLGLIATLLMPAPFEIGQALVKLAASGDLWRHISASFYRFAMGWALGTALAIPAGLAVGLFSLARSVGQPLVSALFPIPKIALLPLFIIWFGIDEWSKIATIAFGVFFPTVIATYAAVDNVPRNLVAMGQSFGLGFGAIVREIVLPGAAPGLLAGFRISSSIGIVLLVAAEMIGAEWGIGALVLGAGATAQTDILLAGVVVLSVFGLAVSFAIGRLERMVLAWR